MVTLASATGWFFSSTTLPLTMPWANAGAENSSATASARTPRYKWVRMLILTLLNKRSKGDEGSINRRPARSLTEETLHRCQVVGHGSGRERIQKSTAISHRPQAGVEDGEDAAVGAVADEAPQALLQVEDGEWDLVVGE